MIRRTSMSSSYHVLPSRSVYPHITTTCSHCSVFLEFPVPSPQPRPGMLLQIRCFSCQNTLSHVFYPTQIPSSHFIPDGGKPAKKFRQIGTQDRPLETGYYDILNVPITATTDDIKKAYRRLAIKHHPDKNPDDPEAEDRFKQIAIAYQTLSDPTLRKKYNEFGPKESAPEGGYVDPEELFGTIFGGERFTPIIGDISLAREMKAALQEAEDAEGQKVAVRAKRVQQLVKNLTRKLGIFTESATGPEDTDVSRSWRTICEIEAEDLKRESYGHELLQAIGFVYVSKAKHHLATNQTIFGVGGWLHNVQGKYHVFSETVSTLRAAIELKSVFDQIQAAEKAGNLRPEERQKLEEQAAEKAIQALFKVATAYSHRSHLLMTLAIYQQGTKLEIESVLREVCDIVLTDTTIPRDKAQLRAVALQMLGEAYMNVKKDISSSNPLVNGSVPEESEYVRIDTKSSRARERS
ncbi:DnaJ-like protein [Leucoagaricus gongylophorus]